MDAFYTPGETGSVRVVAFSGRESDAPLGIWGSIATQLGKKEQFADYYSPLSAPGQTAWVNLLKGDPLVIMLDELPPYFENAKSKTIGNSDLSVVSATALSNLLVAIGKDELSNVCLVITDLTASYAGGSQQIIQALNDLDKETGRSAMSLETVRMNTDEFYLILRKRIFAELPDKETIAEVAQAYAKSLRDARQMDVTNASPEQFAARVADAYSFHPSIRDLYARFKENPGFQQTRGLIRLMRIVASRLWDSGRARNVHLINAYDIDLNDRETLSEINQINSSLENAVSHDIASGGQSVAEILDTNLGGNDSQDVMKLLLVASLSSVAGGTKGLTLPELVANLCAPERDISKLKNEVLNRLVTTAWYLHTGRDGRLFIKNVQNLVARLRTTAESYLHDQSIKELRERLGELFKPDTGWCYQKVQALPAVDEIDIVQDKTVLVIANPHPGLAVFTRICKPSTTTSTSRTACASSPASAARTACSTRRRSSRRFATSSTSSNPKAPWTTTRSSCRPATCSTASRISSAARCARPSPRSITRARSVSCRPTSPWSSTPTATMARTRSSAPSGPR